MTSALARLRAMQAHDTAVNGGRSLAYVFDAGGEELGEAGLASLVPDAVRTADEQDSRPAPTLLQMENELVGFACDLVSAPDTAVGTVTSGGTESVMLTVQGARDSRPWVKHPTLVLPETAHPAFLKAAHAFGVRPVVVPVDSNYRAQVGAMAAALDQNTVLAVASAPSFAHGVVDPIAWIAAATAAKNVPLHVDASVGGWILSYAERIGRLAPAWTFAVGGVSSISMDLHKYGYAPKGASVLLQRGSEDRRPTYLASSTWPGYTNIGTTMQSTAQAWAAVRSIGEEGYLDLARDCFSAVDAVLAGLPDIAALDLVAQPDSTLLALRTDGSCDVFTIADEMVERGWYVQAQPSWNGDAALLHLSLSAATLPLVEECLTALRESVAAAVEAGPRRVDRATRQILESLDPRRLRDSELDRLLAAAGVDCAEPVPGLPRRTAPFQVLLDAAPGPVRESLVAAYLDRLFRPVRRPAPVVV